MRILTTICVVMMMSVPAWAGQVNPGYVGCVTEDSLDEFITAAVNDDERQMNALLGVSCIAIGGFDYSMVDQGFITSEIRVYVGSDSVNVFTPAEATR